ncbi:MAG: dihydroorotase [Methanosarcinales archaeon]|nr:dihydroorotase [Methanosarcinales archaeon]
MPDLIITNARIFHQGRIIEAELAIEDGKIARVARIIPLNGVDRVIDAHNMLVLPGIIDVHVHFREPGMAWKEDWFSGSCAAAAGGVTTVIDHPNTIPPTLDEDSFRAKREAAASRSIVDFGINGGVDHNLDNLDTLWKAGVTAFGEIFLGESTGSMTVDRDHMSAAMQLTRDVGALACIHAEDQEILESYGKMTKGDLAPESYSKSRRNLSEAIAVANTVEDAIAFGARAHLCHISTREAVGIIRRAKYGDYGESGGTITAEAAPHHLLLSNKDYDRLGTLAKMNPPLRKRRSLQYLWNGLNDGTIDIVASDHAPHAESEKMTDIWSAPAGVPGVETMLPLMLVAVRRNLIPLSRMVEVMCTNPAMIFGLDKHKKGAIWKGFDADLVIVDTARVIEIDVDRLHSKAGWTPYEGMEGIFPEITISRGEVIWEDDIHAKKGRGNFLPGAGFEEKPKEESAALCNIDER